VRFPHRIGFNLIPQVGDFNRSAEWSSEELSWSEEAGRIWSAPQLPQILGTAFQAPTFYGHLLNVEVQLTSAPGVEGVRQALKSSAHLKLLDAPMERVYPMPMLASGDPTVHVGRIRELRGWKGGFTFVVAVDNARRGGALNAIEIGQALLAREEPA
jgi:aspartate-semialdehyde dehydrogenase